MKHSDFRIGTEFTTSGGRFRCTDVGTRTIVAIRVDRVTVTIRKSGSEMHHRVLNGSEAEKDGWFIGPPYAVAEHVFDEDALNDCSML